MSKDHVTNEKKATGKPEWASHPLLAPMYRHRPLFDKKKPRTFLQGWQSERYWTKGCLTMMKGLVESMLARPLHGWTLLGSEQIKLHEISAILETMIVEHEACSAISRTIVLRDQRTKEVEYEEDL